MGARPNGSSDLLLCYPQHTHTHTHTNGHANRKRGLGTLLCPTPACAIGSLPTPAGTGYKSSAPSPRTGRGGSLRGSRGGSVSRIVDTLALHCFAHLRIARASVGCGGQGILDSRPPTPPTARFPLYCASPSSSLGAAPGASPMIPVQGASRPYFATEEPKR